MFYTEHTAVFTSAPPINQLNDGYTYLYTRISWYAFYITVSVGTDTYIYFEFWDTNQILPKKYLFHISLNSQTIMEMKS